MSCRLQLQERTYLCLFIPTRHDIQDTREEPCLNTTEEKAHDEHVTVVLGEGHACADGTPQDHDAWKIIGRPGPGEDEIGRNFADKVSDEEDG